jgi:GMP synthase (glutamine-hydrolysing)
VSAPRLLVIQHEDACPPAWFGEWLRGAGVQLDVLAAHRGDDVPSDLGRHDGLLVLGGEMSANDDATCDWLEPTKGLIETVVGADQPLLGICLGHQLMTAALGGEVTRNPNGHAGGLTPVALTGEGHADPLLAGFDGLRSVQWNGEIAARLPEGAVTLATAPDGTVQAARFGERAWGVQFHPEASPEVFRRWTVDKPSARPVREHVIAAVTEIEAAADELHAAWEPLAHRFAQLVRG